ncbi:MAG: PAS domain-containing protein [Rhizobiales bacterium]|nr:PAS domain-containing protein [Hyphomicrobiales bacterium]
MKLRPTRELFAYWNSVRRARAAPDRLEFDPAAIRDILADVFLLEVDAAGRYPVRLPGTRVNAVFGGDLRGRSFLDMWSRPSARRDLARLMRAVSDEAVGFVAGVSALAGVDETTTEFELLALPMRQDGRTHARIIGALACAATPAWLGRDAARLIEMTSLRILTQQSLRGPGPAARRRAHLTVYDGGKTQIAVDGGRSL